MKVSHVTCLAFALSVSSAIPSRAQELQWAQNPVTLRWYGIPFAPTSWPAAEGIAIQKGGHLATIRSAADNTWITQTFAGFNANGYWIGLNDITVEGTFVWTSGEPVTYTNWQPGQPDNAGGVDDAVTISTSTNGKWYDGNPTLTTFASPLVESSQFPQVGWGLPINYSTATSPQNLAIADINSDGRIDVVVPNSGSASFSIYLALPNGTFGLPTVQPTGAGPIAIAIGDLNGDGSLDIAVNCYDNQQVRVYAGDGFGNLLTEYDIGFTSRPLGIVAADLDGDGRSDLAVSTTLPQDRLLVIRSLGGGAFAAPAVYATGSRPAFVSSGDLDNDGDVDLIVSNSDSNDLGVFLNNGAGAFSTSALLSRGSRPSRVAVRDFNSDGKADLAVPNADDNSVRILLGNGTGGFAPGVTLPTGGMPVWALACDLDGDNRTDLATANQSGDSVTLFHSRGDGTFDAGQSFFAGDGAVCLASADTNGNGRPDLIVTTALSNKLVVLTKLSRDCNANNVDDPNDITLGTSPDCNANGIPDECDLALGATFDCNANGLIDSCEIAANAQLDLNHNGTLDQCETAGTPFCFGDGTGSACPCDPGQAGLPGHGCLNSVSASGRLTAVGNPSVAFDSVTLLSTSLLPAAVGLFFQGNLQQNGGLGTTFGDGLLCVNQSVKRLVIRAAVGGAMSFGRDHPNDPPVSTAGQLTAAGGTRYYQVWYRDASTYCTPSTYNLTNGVRILWAP